VAACWVSVLAALLLCCGFELGYTSSALRAGWCQHGGRIYGGAADCCVAARAGSQLIMRHRVVDMTGLVDSGGKPNCGAVGLWRGGDLPVGHG
jgi:hypothetical protein